MSQCWDLFQNNIGMDEALVDAEGFPRSDIDIVAVRTARNQIICLRNDHRRVLQELESGLHRIHADCRAADQAHSASTAVDVNCYQELDKSLPFLIVDRVDAGSPAFEAVRL